MAEWRPPAPSPELARAFGAWSAALRATDARRVAVFVDARESFTGALLAALALGREVVVPGDALPVTVEALRGHVDAFLGEFPGVPTLAPGPWHEAQVPALDPQRCSLVVFTSGSTGAPVAIPKRLSQLLDEVVALEAAFGAELPGWARVYSTVSHQHLYGLLFAVLWPLNTGRGLTSQRLEYPETLHAELAVTDAVLVASPAHLKRLPEGPPWKTKLRAVFSSGGPLPADAARHAEALLGHAPIEVFGSSETGGVAWRTHQHPSWTPLPGVGWRVGEGGRLEVRSPFLATAGWVTLADRAEPEGDTFRLLGRADRVAKIEEKRVSLDAVERGLTDSGLCAEARVVVLEEHRVEFGAVCVPSARGEALLAQGRRALTEALRDFLAARVERVAIPRRFRLVSRLPTNEQGKVTQRALEVLFAPERPKVTWHERAAHHAVLEFTVSPELRVLDGHFLTHPIVPGVAQIDWAYGLAAEVFPLPPNLVRMDALKFQALMRPGDVVRLELKWSLEKSTLTFAYSTPKVTYSSGRLVLSGRADVPR